MTTNQPPQNTGKEVLVDATIVRVKMFIHNQPKDAEKSIAYWLNENDVTIHHIAQSQSEKGGSFIFVLTVFYIENS